ncbi:RibD family protein [Phreatobacter stygius]|uniref:RibD family protein n=1 Tax=Phreatobacter stygius TaxID=1940610 RepID=A0A4D7ARR7_9HYPH|nr:RibD family protein [Phreatobacter stygius]QCI63659.1 RibD family protein [Phreatobacter stygius]
MFLHADHSGCERRSNLELEGPFAGFDTASTLRPFVVAQLGQSLDGRIATLTGHSKYINRSAALDHLHRLRAHVDAVVVGVGTVIADDPLLTVRRVPGRSPARVVIDAGGRLPPDAKCLVDDGVRRIVLRAEPQAVPDGVEQLLVKRLSPTALSPHSIVETLFDAGLKRILIEGGARTVSIFLEHRAVDRLHVLVAPMIIGSGVPGIELPPISVVDDALRPVTRVHQLPDGDVLFDCDLRLAASEDNADAAA